MDKDIGITLLLKAFGSFWQNTNFCFGKFGTLNVFCKDSD